MKTQVTIGTFLAALLPLTVLFSQPNGSITQGLGTTTIADLLPNCPSNHITPLGTITSTDGKIWVVPAETNFQTGPFCADLYNTCNSITPANLAAADVSNVPVVDIDPNGELITGFLFSDNYFELFVNGVLVGVDPIPFTPFNSCVVKFRVHTPYTFAVMLVDWEENPGLGSEINNGNTYHPGDGGFIAQFSDGTVTDSTWRAQTFYIAPIEDLNAVVELSDGTHSTANATTSPTCNANCYGIHYESPADWMVSDFDDSGWPAAVLYTAAQVTNQPAFKNFETTAWNNASFIWSSNLILDNVVLARKTVGTTSVLPLEESTGCHVKNPFADQINLVFEKNIPDLNIRLFDIRGLQVAQWPSLSSFSGEETQLALPGYLPEGIYFLQMQDKTGLLTIKLIHGMY